MAAQHAILFLLQKLHLIKEGFMHLISLGIYTLMCTWRTQICILHSYCHVKIDLSMGGPLDEKQMVL